MKSVLGRLYIWKTHFGQNLGSKWRTIAMPWFSKATEVIVHCIHFFSSICKRKLEECMDSRKENLQRTRTWLLLFSRTWLLCLLLLFFSCLLNYGSSWRRLSEKATKPESFHMHGERESDKKYKLQQEKFQIDSCLKKKTNNNTVVVTSNLNHSIPVVIKYLIRWVEMKK